MAERILSGAGYRVLTAPGPAEALPLLEQYGSVDLLLTDVVMPGMSGRELAEQVAGMYPEIKVLYMSGYPQEVIARRGVLDEGVELVEKPFAREAILRRIREVLDGQPALG